MEQSPPKRQGNRRRVRRWAWALLIVLALHAGALFLFSLTAPPRPQFADNTSVDVFLYVPPDEPEPPPAEPALETGGGAPASPSVIHRPPEPPPEVERELTAPSEPAPEPDIQVGTAPDQTPEPGQGLGGQGTGAGTGTGPGYGPGSGRTRARPIRGPTMDQIRAHHPQNARNRYGRVELSCIVRLDQQLEDCRVVSENPPGMGFGAAAIPLARYFRVLPPTRDGRPVAGQRFTVGIDFGRPR